MTLLLCTRYKAVIVIQEGTKTARQCSSLNYSSYVTEAAMKTVTVVIFFPSLDLLTILLQNMTIITTKTAYFDYFTSSTKQNLFTDSLYWCNKERNTQMVKPQSGQGWDYFFQKYLIHSSSILTPGKHFNDFD